MKRGAAKASPPPAPELVAFVRALAVDLARRDHAAALAATGNGGNAPAQPEST